ncbi:ORF6N domain-containing protein [Eubacterium sp.]|uniref:ORF6N domain-containing protein n=1 Tax=Eubacterium sp. TaxID=142586 RepID=UPI002FC7C5EF
MNINGTALAVKEHQGQRVVTFKDIDAVHGRKSGTARRNFNGNKEHFIENEDYYMLKPNVRNSYIEKIPPKGVTLLTETGYLMLVKSFTDDLAWTVQRELVNNYFRTAEQKPIGTEDTRLPIDAETTYRGKPVVTIRDLTEATGLSKHSIHYAITISGMELGVEYDLLKARALRNYKAENHAVDMRANSLYIIYEAGLRKIVNVLGEGVFGNSLEILQYKEEETTSSKVNLVFQLANSPIALIGMTFLDSDILTGGEDIKKCAKQAMDSIGVPYRLLHIGTHENFI